MAAKTVVAGSNVSALQLKDLFRQIDDGTLNHYHIQALLERRNPFEIVFDKKGFEVEVDYNVPLTDFIKACGITHVEQDIYNPVFQSTRIDKRRERLFLCSCDRPVSSTEAEKALSRFGLEPANLSQLLALTLGFPVECQTRPILACKSHVWRSSDVISPGLYVPYVQANPHGQRSLLLLNRRTRWKQLFRFLATEKTKKL